MQTRVNWFITDQNVTVNYQGQTHIVKRTDPLADNLIRALKENRTQDIPNLVSQAHALENKSKGNVVVRDGELLVKGVRVPAELARKIQKFIDEGLPYQPLMKFAENLQRNPSYRAVNELFQFLEKNDHPFTESGNFIAYKKVRDDFKDVHSGTFDNSVGTVVEIPRNQVDEDSNRTCSHGLHVANYSYASQFYSGGKMLEVEVDPADVVAIPTDYNQSKMRVCKYKVLGVVDAERTGSALRVVDPSYVPADEEEECCEECGHEACQCEDDCCAECGSYDCDGDCAEEEESDWKECEHCGGECEVGYRLCIDCEMEEDEQYPWEDEFEDN